MKDYHKSKEYQIHHNTRLSDYQKEPEFRLNLKERMAESAKEGIPLSDGEKKNIALIEGVWIDERTLESAWLSQKAKFSDKYPALAEMKMPNIIAVYISSNKTFDMVRGEIEDEGIIEEYGITAEAWLKDYFCAGFTMGLPIVIDMKIYHLIVLRHKPQGCFKLNHEIRHVIERELGLAFGTLERERKGKRQKR